MVKAEHAKIKRPAIWVCTAFMCGILLGTYAARHGYCYQLTVAFIVLLAVSGILLVLSKRFLLIFVCAVSLAAASFHGHNEFSYRYRLPDISDRLSLVSGRVLDLTAVGEDYNRYELDDIHIDGRKVYGRMLVSIRDAELNIGDDITFEANVTKPRETRNSGIFDYGGYLANNGIYYTAYIESNDIWEQYSPRLSLISDSRYIINKFKHNTVELSREYLSPEALGIVQAVILGDNMYLDDTQYEAYRKSGTAHVLSISGLHVGFAVVLAGFVTKRLRRYSILYTIINLAIVWGYILISGLNISAVRAGLFFAMYSVGSFAKQRCDIVNIAFITAVVMLVLDPMSIYAVGFGLSFCAVLAIGILKDNCTRAIISVLKFLPKTVADSFSVSLCASVGVVIPIAYHFNTVSLISVLLNLIIVPLFAYVVGAAFVFVVSLYIGVGFVSFAVGTVVNGLVMIADSILSIAMQWRYAALTVPSPTWWVIVIAVFVLILMSCERPRWVKYPFVAVVPMIVAVIFAMVFPYMGIRDTYRLSFIDVGQAECALLVTPENKTVMIDAGTSYGTTGTAEYTIAPYMYKHGNSRIDYLVISHADSDHIGEVDELIKSVEIGNIVYFCPDESDVLDEILVLARENDIELINMYYNRSVRVDKETELFRLSEHFESDSVNNQSLVVEVRCSSRSLVFAGDMEARVLDCLEYPEDIFVYKVAHHGSESSYSQTIMDILPRYSVICTKLGNVYGLPKDDVLERYMEFSNVLLTRDCGEITFTFNDEDYEIYKFLEK